MPTLPLHLLLTVGAGVPLALLAFAVSRHRRRRTEAKAYLRGVRSMISGDPDAAIEALSDAARLGTPQALDSYLALGALFRRTGDLARAVRLHRNMLVGPWLAVERRVEVELELAEDLRRSGMLVEATELLARHAPADARACRALRDVLAERGDFEGAARVQAATGAASPDRLRAHLLAAAARAHLAGLPPRVDLARAAATAAVEADPACADGWMALGEASGDLGAIGRALDAEPAAALHGWEALSRHSDAGEALRFVDARAAAAPEDPALQVLRGRLLHRLGRRPEAVSTFRRALDLDGAGKVSLLLGELLREVEAPAGVEDLQARHDLLVATLLRRPAALRCARCGAEATHRDWRCRGCGAFDALG